MLKQKNFQDIANYDNFKNLNVSGTKIEPLNPDVKAIYEYIGSKFKNLNNSKLNTNKAS